MKNNNRKEIDCNLFFRNISLKWLGIISFFCLKIFFAKNKREKKHSNQENRKPLFTLQQK